MLVITRNVGQKFNLYKDKDLATETTMTISILRINKNQISIGIDAPADITILREEIDPRTAAYKKRKAKKLFFNKELENEKN